MVLLPSVQQALLTLQEHLRSPPVVFICQVLVFYVVFFSIVLTVHRRFTHSMHLLMSSNLSSEPSALKVMLLFLDC